MQGASAISSAFSSFRSKTASASTLVSRAANKSTHSTTSVGSSRKIATSRAAGLTTEWKRWYCAPGGYKCLNKADVESLIKDKAGCYTLIDVREPSEVELGKIPTAKNIPGMFPFLFFCRPLLPPQSMTNLTVVPLLCCSQLEASQQSLPSLTRNSKRAMASVSPL